MDASIFQGPPEAFDEDIVETAPLSVDRYPSADQFQPVGLAEGRELAALIHVHDPQWSEAVDRLVQRFNAEVGLQRVRYPPDQVLASEPIHVGDEIEESTAHLQVGEVGAPDLIWSFHPQTAQQIGVSFVALDRPIHQSAA